ncbi:hypothetical protein HanIR_Chr12g0591671 [Helianthus annuus]|nr:hypothetical protein HanIR_Chr12g0591671 [Helianthus annuus]
MHDISKDHMTLRPQALRSNHHDHHDDVDLAKHLDMYPASNMCNEYFQAFLESRVHFHVRRIFVKYH